MARKCKTRKSNSAIAIIVDGQDEKWYVNKVKENYPCEALKPIKIKPELPQKKKVQKLFDFAKSKLEEGYTYVILIFDMDGPLKDVEEFNKFKELYDKYLCARRFLQVGVNPSCLRRHWRQYPEDCWHL